MTAFGDFCDIDSALPGRIVAALEAFRVPGAVVAAIRGDREFMLVHGNKRHGGTDAVTPSTAFDVGSCAKGHVATAIAILASDGRLALDDPIRKYVPELALDDPWISDHVTIRDFLSNRTGLARQRPIEAFPEPSISILDIVARMRHIRRVRPFRGGYVYFNPGFMTAALIVARVSGQPYETFLAERLFAPLGMVSSASGRLAHERLFDRSSGHTVQGSDVVAINDMIFENMQGAGCVHSSGADALKWLRFHMREEGAGIVAPALLRELHRPHTIMLPEDSGLMHRVPEAELCAYCLGWWTSELHGRRLVQHSGGMFGWRAHTSFIHGADMGVAVCLNAAQNVHHAIAYMILEAMMARMSRDWTAVAQAHIAQVARDFAQTVERAYPVGEEAPLDLSACEGRYTHPAAGDIEIVRTGKGLLVKQLDGRLWDIALKPLGGNIFEAQFDNIAVRDYMPAPARARFVADAGKVTAFADPETHYAKCPGIPAQATEEAW